MFEKLDLRKKSVAEEVDFAYLFWGNQIHVFPGLILDRYKNKKLTKLFHLFLNGEIDVRYSYKIDINQLCQYEPEDLMEKYCGADTQTNSQEDDICNKYEQIYELYKNKASLDDIYNIFIQTIMIEKKDETTLKIVGPTKIYEATTKAGAFCAKMFGYIPFILMDGFLYIIQVDVYKLDKLKQMILI